MRHESRQQKAKLTGLVLGAICFVGCGDSAAHHASSSASFDTGSADVIEEQPEADIPSQEGGLVYAESTEPGAPAAAVEMSDYECVLGADGVFIEPEQVLQAFGGGAVSCAVTAPADGVALFWDGGLQSVWVRFVHGGAGGPWASVTTLDADSVSHRGVRSASERVDRVDLYVTDASSLDSIFIHVSVDGAPEG